MKTTFTHSWKLPSNTNWKHLFITHFTLHGFEVKHQLFQALGLAGAGDASGVPFAVPSMGLAEANPL
jgi:hypothetical protein